jgi:Protein of unknown function (DUF3168)
MNDAVIAVQSAAVTALETHPVLAQILSGVFDGPPPRASYPYISVVDSMSSDWSTKTATGREIRLAINVWDDGEEASRLHNLMGHAEEAIAAMARDLPGWHVASNVFLRSLIARDASGPWTGLVEHRIRVLAV